ncbi:MAG: hypothetical protein OES57_03980 [Acidimicrobiia bacterium]|nr:hypothetical protein [Acidimicrobiia bacterium]
MAEQTDLNPELLASLELFNAHLEQDAEAEKAAKAVAKAERRKDEAAARVRKLNDDPKATADEKAEAEAAYREAVAELAARTEDPLGNATARADGEGGEPSGEETALAEGGEETSSEEPATEETAAEDNAG